MFIQKKRIAASEEMEMDMDFEQGEGEVNVAPEATDLLFEASDVAELVAEITGETVEVTADEDQVTFTVGEDEVTVEPEGDEEVLEACRTRKRKVTSSRNASLRNRRPVAANRRPVASRRPVAASRKVTSKTVRKTPTGRK